jgi:hypothetical protein
LYNSGAIFLNIESLSTRFDFSSTIYVSCDATGYGDNLFIYGDSLSTIIDKHKFCDISNDYSGSFYGELKEGEPSNLNLNSWMSQDNGIYVNDTGITESSESCGSTDNPCKFLFSLLFYLILIHNLFIFFLFFRVFSEGFNKLNPSTGVYKMIIIESSSLNSVIELFTNSITIQSLSLISKSILNVANTGCFISPSTSDLPNLMLGIVFSITSLNNFLFENSVGGRIVLESCEFQGNDGQVLSWSVIKMYGGYVVVKNCIFSGISLSNKNGSCINAEINSGDELNIIGVLIIYIFTSIFYIIFSLLLLYFRHNIYEL